jgi:hypothetical protein
VVPSRADGYSGEQPPSLADPRSQSTAVWRDRTATEIDAKDAGLLVSRDFFCRITDAGRPGLSSPKAPGALASLPSLCPSASAVLAIQRKEVHL